MGPPSDVPASVLWQKLQEWPRPSDVVDFPRKDAEGNPVAKLRIQVLAQEQHDEARERAHRYWIDKRKVPLEQLQSELMRENLGDSVAKELLALACVSVDPISGTTPPRYARLFPDGPSIGQKLTADEIGVLFVSYTEVQSKFGPYEGSVTTEEETTAWIQRLVEGASAYPLVRFDWHRLASFAMSVARRSYTLSEILESQCSSLPDTLKSDLEKLGIGTGSFGRRPVDSSESGPTENERVLPDDPLEISAATAVAKSLFKSSR